MFFDEVIEAPADPIFGLTSTFAKDPRSEKVNLTIGIYKNELLQTETMESVKKAEQLMLKEGLAAEYLPIDGMQEFVESIGFVLFGKELWKLHHGSIYGTQSVGGTGGLRIAAEFIKQAKIERVFISDPTWPNHRSIFEKAGHAVDVYPYYDRALKRFNCSKLLEFLHKVPSHSALCLHAACHNPTGSDPTFEEWKQIAHVMKERKILPLFDSAYQGFGTGVDQDAEAIRFFLKEGMECIVAYSCSKNFSLYGQRAGVLFVCTADSGVKTRIASQIKLIVRTLYSNPPAFGARIAAAVLKDTLRAQWEQDLERMRFRLNSMREQFAARLQRRGKKIDVHRCKGMFFLLNLDQSQVLKLRDQYAVYVLNQGRVSVTGLNQQNLDYVVDSVINVIP